MSNCVPQYVAEHADAPQLASSFEATINKFDKNFSAHLLDLLARLSLYSTSDCEHSMASVISRWVWAASAHCRGAVLCPFGRGPSLPPTLPVLPHCGLRPPREGGTGRVCLGARLRASPPCCCWSPEVTEARAWRSVFIRECAHQRVPGRPVSAPAPVPVCVLGWVSCTQHLAP